MMLLLQLDHVLAVEQLLHQQQEVVLEGLHAARTSHCPRMKPSMEEKQRQD